MLQQAAAERVYSSKSCVRFVCRHFCWLTAALIVRRLDQGLYSCGGSNITRRVRRALSQTFSIRGCRMLGLCSCYDLNDFLASLLQQFASDEQEMGRISIQSRTQEEESSWAFNNLKLPNPLSTQHRQLQQWTKQRYTVNAFGAAQRALTDKVVAARVLFRKMIVAEVGSREPGRYGGLSIYFPDPNMAVSPDPIRSKNPTPFNAFLIP